MKKSPRAWGDGTMNEGEYTRLGSMGKVKNCSGDHKAPGTGDPEAAGRIDANVLHVTQRHRFLEAGKRIAGRNEFLPDISLVADLHQGTHDRRVIDLLAVV